MINKIKNLINNIIDEEFYGNINTRYAKGVEVFKNPNSSDLRELIKLDQDSNMILKQGNHFRLRYFIDGNDDIYMWIGSATLHEDMMNRLEGLNKNNLTCGLVESDFKTVFFDPSNNSLNRNETILRSCNKLRYLFKDIDEYRYEWDNGKYFRLERNKIIPIE